jgi:hypothetical protein
MRGYGFQWCSQSTGTPGMPEIAFGGPGNFHGVQKITFEQPEQI